MNSRKHLGEEYEDRKSKTKTIEVLSFSQLHIVKKLFYITLLCCEEIQKLIFGELQDQVLNGCYLKGR